MDADELIFVREQLVHSFTNFRRLLCSSLSAGVTLELQENGETLTVLRLQSLGGSNASESTVHHDAQP